MSLFLLAVVAGAAFADPPDNALLIPPRQVRALVETYADCVVKNEEPHASDAILRDLSDRDFQRGHPELIQENCIPMALGNYIQMDFTPSELREVVAEALVRREFANTPAPALDDVPGLSHRPASGSPQSAADAYLARYGECVVRVDPSRAKALLFTEPLTDGEAAAINALGTALGTCLAPGKTLNFSKAALRGSIAINYYRLAVAARSAPAAGVPR